MKVKGVRKGGEWQTVGGARRLRGPILHSNPSGLLVALIPLFSSTFSVPFFAYFLQQLLLLLLRLETIAGAERGPALLPTLPAEDRARLGAPHGAESL